MNILRKELHFTHLLRKLSFFLLLISTVVTLLIWNNFNVISATASNSQSFKWSNVNIQGMGYVTGMSVASVKPYDVYVRTDVGGAYRFDRKNNKWLPLMDMFDTSFSGGGIGVESITVDPQKPNRVYAAVKHGSSIITEHERKKYKYSGEVFVSDNRGNTWKSTGLGKKDIFLGANQKYRSDTGERLAVDPNKSEIIYFASRRDGLWRKNGNQEWVKVSSGLPAAKSLPQYNKSDGKENKDLPGFTFVAFDKNSAKANQATKIIYVGVHGKGVWQSKNAGQTWRNIGGGKDPLRGTVASDGTLYVSFGTKPENGGKKSGGVRKYKNEKWNDITPDSTKRVYSAVAVQGNNPNQVISISDKYLYRSKNGGRTWDKQTMYMGAYDANNPKDKVNPSAPKYYQSYSGTGASVVVFDPGNPKQVWWTNGWGVACTDNVTAKQPNFKWVMNNLEELDPNILRVPPVPKSQGGADLISGVQDMIGFRHVNRHKVPNEKINPANIDVSPYFKWANPEWKKYPVPFPHVAAATGMDYAYKKPKNAAFVGFHQWQGYYPIHGFTQDNGKTWQAFESVPTENMWSKSKSKRQKTIAMGGQIAMSPTNPKNMVWAPTWGPYTHYTKDGGKTWKLAHNLDHDPKPEPFDPNSDKDTHYDALPKSWANSINPYLSSYILAADRQDPKGQTFYYYNGWTFFYSKDGGANWKKGASKLPTWMVRPAIVPNPTKQGDVWMSFARNPEDVEGNKLYRSTDGGQNFKPIASVDTCEFVTFGKGSSDKNPSVYIFGRVGGAKKNAMYVSKNMGRTWKRISNPQLQQFPGITWLEGDMRKSNLVYAALSGRGIMAGEQ
ncbi:putative sialidase [Calothrix parasitica NIES-267]|uniref:Putative sialidase n=1 Tax=Calothrix parasitica NIES-267 TaxID=1973488 RepID=A0A1Z4LMV0_9CYAN|nr:putative sialidase [Calothrix parasitica NIES-267]